MKYFLLMGLVSVASAALAMGPDEFRVTDSEPLRDEDVVASPIHWLSHPSN